MNYYSFHVGDWSLHTSHLTIEEEGVYRRLLDFYYDTESPIPETTQPVIRRLRLGSYAETVALILAEFFVLEADGWHNHRADLEIIAYRNKAAKAQENGKKGGRPPKNSGIETKPVNSANPEITGSKANQEPRTKNQEPITKEDQKHLVTAVTDFDSFWKLYPRKTAKAEAQKAWAKLNPDYSLLAEIATGLTAHIVCADWVKDDGNFIPHGSTWINQRRWEDSPKPASNVVKLNRHGDFDKNDYSDGLQAREDGTNAF